MALYLTSSNLIRSIKSRALIPTNQATFTDADFLRFANEELLIGLIPSILSFNEDYLLKEDEIPLVSGQNNYKIPANALGNRLRDVKYKDNSGTIFEMSRISIGDIHQYSNSNNAASHRHFYVKNDEIVLLGTNSGVGVLLMSYYRRPNEIVEEKRGAVITNIQVSGSDTIITVNKIPTEFAVTLEMDLNQTKSPHQTLTEAVIPTAINSLDKTITFNTIDVPDELKITDHICLTGETIVPQVPTDLHVVLAQRVAARCLESLGDTQGLGNANAKIAEMEQKTSNILNNRVEDAPKKVVNFHSLLRHQRRWNR